MFKEHKLRVFLKCTDDLCKIRIHYDGITLTIVIQ